MIKGLDIFIDFFHEFNEQYVIIGGVACDIIFDDYNIPFRATKDIDMVLIVEALTPEFGRRFWDFINTGEYENRAKSNGIPQFYRFDKPKNPGFPFMIELFAKSESLFDNDSYNCRPLHFEDEISSLSAILLNSDYYQLLLVGREIISGVPILPSTYIILFKMKAWLDLSARKKMKQNIAERDIRKHKNDVARLTALLTGNESIEIPQSMLNDLYTFLDAFEKEPPDLKSLNIPGVTINDIVDLLKKIYH
jgi:hypothetical protein